MLWSRKPAPVHDRTRAVGIDLTASRALAEAVGGKSRELLLDGAEAELPLFVACDRRVPEVGHAGLGLCRRAPHCLQHPWRGVLEGDVEIGENDTLRHQRNDVVHVRVGIDIMEPDPRAERTQIARPLSSVKTFLT